jgi:DNA repair protein RecO (recombination protein O)
MPFVSDRCICLRKIEYSETSQIVVLLSRGHGVQRLMAKGAHRRTKAGASKFDGGVDLLEVGDAVFSQKVDRDLGLLTEWTLSEGHLEIRRNLRAMYLGLYAAELVGLLFQEHDAHPALFDQLENCLSELGTARVEETFLAFELDAFREAGFSPELDACGSCGQAVEARSPAEMVYFSAAQGTVLCRNCCGAFPDHFAVDPRLLNLLRGLTKLPRVNGAAQRLPRLTRHQTDPLNRIFADHLEHTLGRRMRMRKYIL